MRTKSRRARRRLAFQAYEEIFGGPRWSTLAAAGARPQRPLWASTGVKDPAYPDTMYVDELITAGVVNTMPEPTLRAYGDHGAVAEDRVRGHYAEARATLDALAALGVDYDDVVAKLEDEGVDKFVKSWDELLGSVGAELERLAGDAS